MAGDHGGGAAPGHPRVSRRAKDRRAGRGRGMAQERLDRAVAAQQARCDDWDARNAAKTAQTGTGLSGPRPAEPGEYVRVQQARAHLEEVKARAAARQQKKEEQEQGRPRAMAERLKTPDGIAACRRRGHIAETPHGHIKHNMGFRQLTMRGKTKAKAEWTFITTVHNLFKAISTGHLTASALTALAS